VEIGSLRRLFPALPGLSVFHTVIPKNIHIEAISACQLNCPSCPTARKEIQPVMGNGFLRSESLRQILEENPQLRHIELSNYGEALLNPELLKILELAHERGVAVSIGGANLNTASDALLEGIVQFQVRWLSCSIDGASSETYPIYRVGGDFSQVIKNIEKINLYKREYGTKYPRLGWQFIVFGHNEHEIEKAREHARNLGMEFHLKLSWDEEFSPIRDKKRVRALLGAASREEYREVNSRSYLQNTCNMLWDDPQINWDGKVFGCCRNFWGDFGGNALTDELVKSVNNEKMMYARKILQGEVVSRSDIPCATCDIYLTMNDTKLWLQRDPARRFKQLKQYSRHHVSRLLRSARRIYARSP
jgi:MoaA/NifB/PqqE/SkfB family radical SAM enzyme